jgi:hypothetical protein
MAAKVDLRYETGSSAASLVPTFAVGHDSDGHYVYILQLTETELATAIRTGVKVGELTGDGLEIVDGLQGGETIVIAGVPRVIDGMAVRVQKTNQ